MLIPCPEDCTVVGSIIGVELSAALPCRHYAIVHIVGALTTATRQLLAIGRPRQGIARTAILLQTVGTLPFIAHEVTCIAAASDNDGIVGS